MNTVIIVLGSPNDEKGNLSTFGIERCEQALLEYANNPSAMLLCTGGFGAKFNVTNQPHSFYTQQYLLNKGVPQDRFLPLVLSRFTLEDATLAQHVISDAKITHAILVTSDFHMPRATFVFDYIYPHISFSYAPTKTILPTEELALLRDHESNAMPREYENKRLFINK